MRNEMKSSKYRRGGLWIVVLTLVGSALSAGRAQAALVTHSVNVTLNATNVEAYDLDLDQNGTTDFTFTAAFVDVGIGIVGFDTIDVPFASINGVVIDSSPGSGFPTASLLGPGAPVSAASLFSLSSNDQSNLFFVTPFDPPSGNFEGKTGFVGLKFDRGGQTHFGFAEITVNALASATNPLGLTIRLVGYNDVADEGTVTSQTPEPGTLTLSIMGFVLVGGCAWRKRRVRG
jgi:hypothetical protein